MSATKEPPFDENDDEKTNLRKTKTFRSNDVVKSSRKMAADEYIFFALGHHEDRLGVCKRRQVFKRENPPRRQDRSILKVKVTLAPFFDKNYVKTALGKRPFLKNSWIFRHFLNFSCLFVYVLFLLTKLRVRRQRWEMIWLFLEQF